MKNSKKINLEIKGEIYQLPITALHLKENSSYNEPTHIQMSAKHTASIIKQFVKKKYPTLKVWALSSQYSGGSSTRIHICNEDGSLVKTDIYEDIRSFGRSFKAGSFDGMYDIYNYRDDDVKTDNGTPLKYFPSYVFVENSPKWGSVEYWVNDYNGYKNLSTDKYSEESVNRVEAAGGYLKYNKTFMTTAEYNRFKPVFEKIKIK